MPHGPQQVPDHRQPLAGLVVLALIGFLVVCGLTLAASAALASPRLSVFGTAERQSADLAAFTKWTGVVDGYGAETAAPEYRALDRFLATLKGASRRRQLAAVNAFVHAKGYVSDVDNWGQSDYWATPAEFLARGGDCEDHAIAKFFALKRLGWAADALRLVTVKDRRGDVLHTVLVAFDGETSWLLDNQITDVVAAAGVSRYRPLYSINEGAWWRHGGRV